MADAKRLTEDNLLAMAAEVLLVDKAGTVDPSMIILRAQAADALLQLAQRVRLYPLPKQRPTETQA